MEAVTPAAPEVLLYCSNPEGKCTNKTTELNLLDDIVREQKCFDPSLTKDQLDRMMTQMTVKILFCNVLNCGMCARDSFPQDPKVVPNMPYFTNNVSPKYGNCLYFNLFNGLVQETLGRNGGLSVLFRTSDGDGPRVGAFFSQDGMVVQVVASSKNMVRFDFLFFLWLPGLLNRPVEHQLRGLFRPSWHRRLPRPGAEHQGLSSPSLPVKLRQLLGRHHLRQGNEGVILLRNNEHTEIQQVACRHVFFTTWLKIEKLFARGLCESFCNARASLRECGCHISAFDAVNVRYLWREKNQEGLDCIMPVGP